MQTKCQEVILRHSNSFAIVQLLLILKAAAEITQSFAQCKPNNLFPIRMCIKAIADKNEKE
jgi:hypothetical protein